jgi:hypothetical protein
MKYSFLEIMRLLVKRGAILVAACAVFAAPAGALGNEKIRVKWIGPVIGSNDFLCEMFRVYNDDTDPNSPSTVPVTLQLRWQISWWDHGVWKSTYDYTNVDANVPRGSSVVVGAPSRATVQPEGTQNLFVTLTSPPVFATQVWPAQVSDLSKVTVESMDRKALFGRGCGLILQRSEVKGGGITVIYKTWQALDSTKDLYCSK